MLAPQDLDRPEARRTGRQPAWIVALQAISVLAFVALWCALVAQLVRGRPSPGHWLAVLAAAPLAYLAADLVSGMVHWFCDTFFEEDTPLVGALIIHPFREHHREPLAMTAHGPLELTGNTALALAPFLALALWALGDGGAALVARGALAVFAAAIFATNLFHYWAHAPEIPAVVRRLQSWRLILTPAGHADHHRGGYDGAYCITTGWLNRWLDASGFFRGCERLLVALGVPKGSPR